MWPRVLGWCGVVGRWYDRLGTARHGTARAGMPRRTEPHHGMPGLGTLRRHATARPGSGRHSSAQLDSFVFGVRQSLVTTDGELREDADEAFRQVL